MKRGLDSIETTLNITVDVEYRACPAEPDVGIPQPYGEIQAVMFHKMNILHWLTPDQVEELEEAVGEHMRDGGSDREDD